MQLIVHLDLLYLIIVREQTLNCLCGNQDFVVDKTKLNFAIDFHSAKYLHLLFGFNGFNLLINFGIN